MFLGFIPKENALFYEPNSGKHNTFEGWNNLYKIYWKRKHSHYISLTWQFAVLLETWNTLIAHRALQPPTTLMTSTCCMQIHLQHPSSPGLAVETFDTSGFFWATWKMEMSSELLLRGSPGRGARVWQIGPGDRLEGSILEEERTGEWRHEGLTMLSKDSEAANQKEFNLNG